MRCNICSRYNLFAAVCRYERDTHASTQNSSQPGSGYQNRRKRRVKRTKETDLDSDQFSDDEFLTYVDKLVKKTYGLKKTIPLMVNDIHIRAEPDTGADVNVMDEYQYRASLQHMSTSKMDLQNNRVELRKLQNELLIKGEFKAILKNQTCGK